jgi:hypothetical protein
VGQIAPVMAFEALVYLLSVKGLRLKRNALTSGVDNIRKG